MSILFFIVLISFFVDSYSQKPDVQTVDLLVTDNFEWEGFNSGSTSLVVTAEGYSISVNIETCDIGNSESRPNKEYLILKNGDKNPVSQDNGRIFAYIKKPKTIYFFSSTVILQLETPDKLKKKCTVTFEKGDEEDPTLPPVTTTETARTYGPEVSKYSTVLISGKSIDQFNANRNLAQELKEDIALMAENYTALEGFCLTKNIEPSDVDIYTLEQCPTQWPDFENCVRLVYAIPVKMDDSCSLWQGYQMTAEHLDVMWSRLSSEYLQHGFSVYEQPEINSLLTWWIICMVILILMLAASIIAINLIWRRRQFLKRAQAVKDKDYIPDMRKISEMSLTPPYFQPIPPMFGKTETYEDMNGLDNDGFQYGVLNTDENVTTI